MDTLLPFLGLLLGALGVALVASRFRVPYTLALVLFGLLVGVLMGVWSVPGLTGGVRALFAPGIFFALLLPPIVFEAALHIDARRLRAHAPLVLFLVFVGVVFTTIFTGYALAGLAALPLAAALLLAAILSPTDPVAVIDLFRRLKVPAELSTIVESESLLNDAVGIILFVVLFGIVTGGPVAPGAIALEFAWLVVGGLAVGGATAALARLLVRPMRDPIAGTALSLLAAYGSFLVATDIGASGILATAVAGLAVGTWVVPGIRAAEGRVPLFAFWSVAVYVVNSVIFLTMGLVFGASGILGELPLIAGVFLLITIGRGIFVYAHRPLATALGGRSATLPRAWYDQLAVSGVRGAIPVVLALSVGTATTRLAPSTVHTLVATALGVVLVSLFVNNLVAEWFAATHFAPSGPGPPSRS